jgi:hypothetical protein
MDVYHAVVDDDAVADGGSEVEDSWATTPTFLLGIKTERVQDGKGEIRKMRSSSTYNNPEKNDFGAIQASRRRRGLELPESPALLMWATFSGILG